MKDTGRPQRSPVVAATTKAINALEPADKPYYKLFSKGLGVRVHPRPSNPQKQPLKTFCHYYTRLGEKHKTFVKLGHFNPQKMTKNSAQDLTLEEALVKNQQIIDDLRNGVDPRASKRDAAKLQSNPDAKTDGDSDDTKEKPFAEMTIANLVTDYLKFVEKNKAPATYCHYRDTLNTFILEPWKTRLAKDLKKTDAYRLVKKVAEKIKSNGDTVNGL